LLTSPDRYELTRAVLEACEDLRHVVLVDAESGGAGSTGRPKGVVLSHRNMLAGAKSVAQYLENTRSDTLLAALPLSFDAGFSQLTTAFHVGARVVLLNYLLPKDVS
jgi:acyl-CoA synthetase (AMP-forming)/AMP-acid ligase II